MKNIIITGSSSGFGFYALKTIALKGHKVFATMRNIKTTNAAVAAEINDWAKKQNAFVEIIEMDVASNESVKKAFADIALKSGGRIDVLINNAGVSFMGITETLSIEQTEQMFQVNTFGPERTIKAVLPYMRDQKQGLIINITSVQSRQFIPVLTTYNATKAALDAASVGYHYELKPLGIDVATLQPGSYQTTDIVSKSIVGKYSELENLYSKDMLDFKEAMYKHFTPTSESGNPQDVADAMAALIEMPAGKRPLWTIVGGGPQSQKFEKINQLIKEIVEFNLPVN